MDILKVFPVIGRMILMPHRDFSPVPDEGVNVVRDNFWSKALLDGDVTETPPETSTADQPEVAPALSGEDGVSDAAKPD